MKYFIQYVKNFKIKENVNFNILKINHNINNGKFLQLERIKSLDERDNWNIFVIKNDDSRSLIKEVTNYETLKILDKLIDSDCHVEFKFGKSNRF